MTSFRLYIILMVSCLTGWALYGYSTLRDSPSVNFSPAYIQKNEEIKLDFVRQQNLAVLPSGQKITYWQQLSGREGVFQVGVSSTANIEGSQLDIGSQVVFSSQQLAIANVLDSGSGRVALSAEAKSSDIKGIHALEIGEKEISLSRYLSLGKALGEVGIGAAITEDKSSPASHAAVGHKYNTPFWAMTFKPVQTGYLEKLDLLLKNSNAAVVEYFLSVHEVDIHGVPEMSPLHTQSFSAEKIQGEFKEHSFVVPASDAFLEKGKTYAVVLSTGPLSSTYVPLLQRGRGAAFLEWFGLGSSYDEGTNFYSSNGRNWTRHDRDLFLRAHIRPFSPYRVFVPGKTYAALFQAPLNARGLKHAKITVEENSNGGKGVYIAFGVSRVGEDVWYIADSERDTFLPIARKRDGKWEIKGGYEKKQSWTAVSYLDDPSVISKSIDRYPANASTITMFNSISSEAWDREKLLHDVEQVNVAIIFQNGKTDNSLEWDAALSLTGYVPAKGNDNF